MLTQEWSIQEAKNKLSEVINKTQTSGAQFISRRGETVVVVLSIKDYGKLLKKQKKNDSLVDFFQQSPLKGLELDLSRNRDISRDLPL